MNNAINKQGGKAVAHEAPVDEHRLRSERIAARGVSLGARKARYLVPLFGLAVLASVAFAQA